MQHIRYAIETCFLIHMTEFCNLYAEHGNPWLMVLFKAVYTVLWYGWPCHFETCNYAKNS